MLFKNTINRLTAIIIGMVLALNVYAQPDDSVIVNIDNFVRAETAFQFDRTLALLNKEVNTFVHIREPIPLAWIIHKY